MHVWDTCTPGHTGPDTHSRTPRTTWWEFTWVQGCMLSWRVETLHCRFFISAKFHPPLHHRRGREPLYLTHTLSRFCSISIKLLSLFPSLHHHYHFASLLLKHISISKAISLFLWQLLQVPIRCDRFRLSLLAISSSSFAPSSPAIISLAAWASVAKCSKQFSPTSLWRLLVRLSFYLSVKAVKAEQRCWQSGEGRVHRRFPYVNDLMNLLLRRGTFGHKSTLPSPPCRFSEQRDRWIKCNERHLGGTHSACMQTNRHTHKHCQITLSLLPFLSLLFSSPLSSVSSSRSQIPGLFSPFLSLPLFCVLSHSNPSLASFVMTKEQPHELAPAGVHGNNPFVSPTLSPLHQGIPWTPPDPFNPLATSYLQKSS